jgi:hypothetical protein
MIGASSCRIPCQLRVVGQQKPPDRTHLFGRAIQSLRAPGRRRSAPPHESGVSTRNHPTNALFGRAMRRNLAPDGLQRGPRKLGAAAWPGQGRALSVNVRRDAHHRGINGVQVVWSE